MTAGTPPNFIGSGIADKFTEPLPNPLLEVRRGPDVAGSGGQSDTMSAQNVFVLIAPGENRNTVLGRTHVRDSSHTDGTANPWPLNITNVDTRLFSSTTNIDPTDRANDGDDTLLVMSFFSFRASVSWRTLRICECARCASVRSVCFCEFLAECVRSA